jgi:hypothetical protein
MTIMDTTDNSSGRSLPMKTIIINKSPARSGGAAGTPSNGPPGHPEDCNDPWCQISGKMHICNDPNCKQSNINKSAGVTSIPPNHPHVAVNPVPPSAPPAAAPPSAGHVHSTTLSVAPTPSPVQMGGSGGGATTHRWTRDLRHTTGDGKSLRRNESLMLPSFIPRAERIANDLKQPLFTYDAQLGLKTYWEFRCPTHLLDRPQHVTDDREGGATTDHKADRDPNTNMDLATKQLIVLMRDRHSIPWTIVVDPLVTSPTINIQTQASHGGYDSAGVTSGGTRLDPNLSSKIIQPTVLEGMQAYTWAMEYHRSLEAVAKQLRREDNQLAIGGNESVSIPRAQTREDSYDRMPPSRERAPRVVNHRDPTADDQYTAMMDDYQRRERNRVKSALLRR